MSSQRSSKTLVGRPGCFALGLLLFCLFGAFVPSSSADNEAIGCSPGPFTQTISYGTVASCTIEYPYMDESDVFQFSATYGETVIFILPVILD